MFVLLFLLLCVSVGGGWGAGEVRREYCIVGAGPSGLQMAYFLHNANRDYIVFERNSVPGSFYEKYPRHRKLISINKRYTGKTNKEFNLRHDWNSLISHDESLLFTKYSTEYFPQADDLLRYLKDFQEKLGLRVEYNTEVGELKAEPNEAPSCRYSMKDQRGNKYCCKVVLVGVGIDVPTIPEMRGGDLLEGYESLDINPTTFEGQSVLLIGRGNSGMELASSIYGYANFVHLVGRSRIKFSWETHYVGDIRGVNNEVLDSYMLKSLDGVFEAGTEEMYFIRREDGRIMLRAIDIPELNTNDQNPVREGYDRVIRCLGFHTNTSLFHNSTLPKFDEKTHANADSAALFPKYPDIHYDFQSKANERIYFLGPLTHGLDYRKSAGGFIHGYRYNARVLHRLLEWKFHGKKWPSTENSIDQLLPSILKRANEGSGIYQMFQFLGDVIIVDRETDRFTYLEEFPLKLIPKLVESTGHPFASIRHALIVLSMEYGANFSRAGEDHFGDSRAHGSVDDAHKSNFLHPVIYYYNNLFTQKDLSTKLYTETLPRPDGIHHVLEDFTTLFDGPTIHMLPLRRFLEFFLQTDLRVFLGESCITYALTSHLRDSEEDLPLFCQKYLNSPPSLLPHTISS